MNVLEIERNIDRVFDERYCIQMFLTWWFILQNFLIYVINTLQNVVESFNISLLLF